MAKTGLYCFVTGLILINVLALYNGRPAAMHTDTIYDKLDRKPQAPLKTVGTLLYIAQLPMQQAEFVQEFRLLQQGQ